MVQYILPLQIQLDNLLPLLLLQHQQHLHSMFQLFLCHNAFCISKTSTALYHSPQQFSLTTSDSNSFAVSYLIHKLGFSHEFALKASKKLYFKTSQKPDSVINFFKIHGFNDSDIHKIIKIEPWLLSCNTHKTILPKFQFLISKGASSSDIVRMVSGDPKFLQLSLKKHEIKFDFFLSKVASSSDIIPLLTAHPAVLYFNLEKRIIPLFELLSRFLKTDKDAIHCLIRHSNAFSMTPYHLIADNVNLMSDFGVSDSVIAGLLKYRPSIVCYKDLIKSLEEVKGLGFDPSTTSFEVALAAKKGLSKKLWYEKVDAFKKWGWSDEVVIQAFRVQPNLMLTSLDKIDLLMNFWVNQLGWNSLELTKLPQMFNFSLEKRIIPRALIVQFLLMKGLRKKNASLVVPFRYSEKIFLSKFVFRFKEESDYLLKLYEEQGKLANRKENNSMMSTNSFVI